MACCSANWSLTFFKLEECVKNWEHLNEIGEQRIQQLTNNLTDTQSQNKLLFSELHQLQQEALRAQSETVAQHSEILQRQVTELDTTVLSIQVMYNELFCLLEKLILDNDTMDKELLELRSYKNLLEEREARASKELNFISQRNDQFFQLNSKMSALQEKNSVMQSELYQEKIERKIKLNRDARGRFCPKKESTRV